MESEIVVYTVEGKESASPHSTWICGVFATRSAANDFISASYTDAIIFGHESDFYRIIEAVVQD